jgi:hypothetical protein
MLGGVCFFMFEGDDLPEKFILGDSFHQSYLSTYEFEYKYVGFAPHKFSNSTITRSKISTPTFVVVIVEASLIGIFIIFFCKAVIIELIDYCRSEPDGKVGNVTNNEEKQMNEEVEEEENGQTPP